MDQLNERIETVLLKRHVTKAVLLVSKELSFSRRQIIFLIIVSLVSVLFFGLGHLNFTDWTIGLFLIVCLWGMPAFLLYLILRVRNLNRLRLSLNHPISYDLNNNRVSVCYSNGLKLEFLWSEVTKYMKSSEVTLLYAAGRKAFIFFPNAILSEKLEAYLLEAFSRGQKIPPVISRSASPSPKRYLGVIVIILVLVSAFLLYCHNFTPMHSDLPK